MRTIVLAVGGVLALGLLPSGAAQTAEALRATVTPDAITLARADGSPVSNLPAGTYEVVVEDRGPTDDFQLRGPGVERHTGLSFTGTVTWTVALTEGHYRYLSSPREDRLRGRFTVGSPPAPTLVATVDDGRIALTRDGSDVERLDPGTYAIAVDDRSDRNNFRLTGPGVDEHSQYHVRAQATWTVRLAEGTYFYFSERNPDRLHGSFTVGNPPPPAGGSPLAGVTGPDFAIVLLNADSSPVTDLRPGTYTVLVDDASEEHNFHLSGPGVERTTALSFVGRASWTVTLGRGLYSFVCDPHTLTMNGAFTVAGGAAPPPPAPRRLTGTVAPGGAVSLTPRRVRSGALAITVRDRSSTDNFHLLGAGVNRKTGISFRGTATWRVRLAPGRYAYRSDVHLAKRGTLVVVP